MFSSHVTTLHVEEKGGIAWQLENITLMVPTSILIRSNCSIGPQLPRNTSMQALARRLEAHRVSPCLAW